MTLEEYYRERAASYDDFYQVPRRQEDLAELKAWLVKATEGLTILEVAAGTGYWTQVAATVAKAITATDYNRKTLAIATQRKFGPHVTFMVADAYRLPEFAAPFDAGMAMLWWSHVKRERRGEFLKHFSKCLRAGSLILMIDQSYLKGVSNPVSRKDEFNNLYTIRFLPNGARYEIVKNYPSDEELHDSFSEFCDEIVVTRLCEFWALSARVRTQTT